MEGGRDIWLFYVRVWYYPDLERNHVRRKDMSGGIFFEERKTLLTHNDFLHTWERTSYGVFETTRFPSTSSSSLSFLLFVTIDSSFVLSVYLIRRNKSFFSHDWLTERFRCLTNSHLLYDPVFFRVGYNWFWWFSVDRYHRSYLLVLSQHKRNVKERHDIKRRGLYTGVHVEIRQGKLRMKLYFHVQ